MTGDKHQDASADDEAAADQAAEGTKRFRLAGSLEVLVSDDELEAGIAAERARQAELFEAKMRRWMED